MKKIFAVVGARPQFVKHAPMELALKDQFHLKTIHTGQHYDKNMSDVFFEQLQIRRPDFMLNVGSHSHAVQTAKMMMDIEEILIKESPDGFLVYGDTNSTLAGALVASKLGIPVFHVEAGLRGYNKELPEEINRIMTDHISSLLFAPTKVAVENLNKEGIESGVHRSGDIMFDMALIAQEQKITETNPYPKQTYYLCTIHRPYNVDEKDRLLKILNVLQNLKHKVVLPLHPRTKKSILTNGIPLSKYTNLMIKEPVSYFENIALIKHAQAVITDSGGVQKETYFLKKKCITLRSETEWVETLHNDWNHLLFEELETMQQHIDKTPGKFVEDFYGTGKSAQVMAEIIRDFYE